MRRSAGIVLGVCAAVASGCLGGSDPSGPRSADGAPARGGTLVIKAADDILTLDPGMTSGDDGSVAVLLMHRPLYNFFPGDTLADPDVASGPPRISADGRTVTVRLRPGVRYDAPVNREIRADDVRYAFERIFTRNVINGYAPRTYGDLVGLEAFRSGRASRISGIETPDARTVVFRLRRGSGANFAGALALYASAPVPRDYARRFDREEPSTYGEHAPSTGPYRVARRDRGRRLVLERNPAWNPETDPRPAHVDRVEIHVGGDPPVLSKQIARGRGMISGQFPVSGSVLRRLAREAPDRIGTVPGGAVSVLSLNTTLPPLDRGEVRRAIAAALDRRLIAKLLGGRYARTATHFLPPQMPGFAEAGGYEAVAPFLRDPEGDRDLARRYLRGVPASLLRRPLELLAPDAQAGHPDAAEQMATDLRAVGLDVELRIVSPEGAATLCSNPARRIHMCVGGVFPPPDQPQIVLELLFHGRSISSTANPNHSQLDDPGINAALDAAAVTVDPRERAAAYGAVDRRIVATVAAVPLAWTTLPAIRSPDVEGPIGPGGWDPAFLSVR